MRLGEIDIQEAREAIARVQNEPKSMIWMTPNEFGALNRAFIYMRQQLKSLESMTADEFVEWKTKKVKAGVEQ